MVGFDQLDREQIYQSVKTHPFRIENSVSSHIDSNFKLSLHQFLWWNILSKKLDFYSLLVHQWGFEANELSIRVPRLRKSIADFDEPWNTSSVTKKRNFNFRPIIECGQTDEQFPFCVLNLSGLGIEKNYLRVEKKSLPLPVCCLFMHDDYENNNSTIIDIISVGLLYQYNHR